MASKTRVKCPICSGPGATSPHHIQPTSDGGNNTRRNKILLCKRCHDIVEDIYNTTGTKLSPDLIILIRLEYKFPDITSVDVSIRESSLHYAARNLYRRSVRRRFPDAKKGIDVPATGVALRCPYCRGWHYPNKRGVVVCPRYKEFEPEPERTQPIYNPEIDEFYNKLRQKLVNV